MRPRGWALAVVSSVMAGGCAVGPTYKRPQVAVPSAWTVSPARGTSDTSIARDECWSSFQDAEINSLIERAELRKFPERVRGRAWDHIAKSGYFPSVDAAVSATPNRQTVIAPVPPGSVKIIPVEFNKFQGDLAASWELDVVTLNRAIAIG